MNRAAESLTTAAAQLIARWREEGLPSREKLLAGAEALTRLGENSPCDTLWPRAPRMLTATLDDALGQGLDIIEAYGRAMGVRIDRLGLMPPADAVIAACRTRTPDYLGLTVLQIDSEADLAAIAAQLPGRCRIIAGGPAFVADPDLAQRAGIQHVARHVGAFLAFLLHEARAGRGP